MPDFLGGSVIMRACGRLGKRISKTAQVSLLFGRRKKRDYGSRSKLVAAMNRVHPAEAVVTAMGRSGLFGWLYRYWGRLVNSSVSALLWLLTPFLGLLTVSMAAAGRWMAAGALLLALGAAFLILFGGGSLADWLGSSLLGRWIGKHCAFPAAEQSRSLRWYLGACGLIGGGIGWVLGVKLAVVAAVGLAGFPILFAIPTHWMVCLLCLMLPLTGTSICWALSFVIVILYFFGRAFRGERGKKVDTVDLLLLIFPLLCVVSTVFSFAVVDSAKVSAMWLGLFACVFFIRRAINTKRRLMAVLGALTIGAVLSGAVGLYQYLSGTVNTTWTDTNMFQELELRVYSTFANPNVYGEFLLLMIPITAALAMYTSGKKRWLLVGVNAMLLVNLVLTYSRGCYVGILITALIYLWNFSKKWLSALLVLGVPLALLLMPASVVERIMSIGNMADHSTSYRMMIYVGTLLMLAHYWLGGVGIGELAYNAIYPYYALTGIVAPHSHSLFFQSVVSFGIVGLIWLLLMWWVYQRRTKRTQLRMERRDRLLMIGFNAVFWGMMLQSAFDYTWYNYRVFQLFWIVFVLGIAAAEVLTPKKEEIR